MSVNIPQDYIKALYNVGQVDKHQKYCIKTGDILDNETMLSWAYK